MEDTKAIKVGDKIDVSLFKAGDLVDVIGISKGKGFAGGVKRYHFNGGPKTHGQSDRHRAPGLHRLDHHPGRVLKGTAHGGAHGRRAGNRTQAWRYYRPTRPATCCWSRAPCPGSTNGLLLIKKSSEEEVEVQVPVYNLTGEVVRQIEISDKVFAVPFNEAVVHQVMVRQQANARQGTASTKTRGEVAAAPGSCTARRAPAMPGPAASRSPLRRGGGITFGPKPRSYRQEMPKKMRRLALRCVLSAKARRRRAEDPGGIEF